MLEFLKLNNVGPAPEMELELAPRINVITGDNGLGKSFLLDIAWWVLTRTWAGLQALPTERRKPATISFRFDAKTTAKEDTLSFDRLGQGWPNKRGRPAKPGLILYARADGSFSIWDPARNYWWKKNDQEFPDRLPAFHFSPREIWDGKMENGKPICNGLIRDWVSWKESGKPEFDQLRRALKALSPSSGEQLLAGDSTRISIDDARDMPTLRMPYGQDVAVVHASAGMRRILALAYLLVWAWQEHRLASQLLAQPPTRRIIFMVDELESHLHPRWQRVILPSILEVAEVCSGSQSVDVQLIAATHSPLILASLEPHFDEVRDAWFDLDLEPGSTQNGRPCRVELRKRDFVRHGDVSNWLTSEAFDLKAARSAPAEQAIESARALLRQPGMPDLREAKSIDEELRRAGLPDIDPFWVRWGAFIERLEKAG